MGSVIRIRGAAQHCLKHFDLDLPQGRIIALLGPSGSGKSTLAYDTLFAESRRRFLDCLSPHARQLLTRPEKPAFDSITGLPPALCLKQHASAGPGHTPLGTLTEALDYLRIIYAAIGTPHDPVTGAVLTKLSPDEIIMRLAALPEGTRLILLAPMPASFGVDDPEADFRDLRRQGFLRIRANGEILDLDDIEPSSLPRQAELVVDRMVVRPSSESRLADSLQTALRMCADEVRVLIREPNEECEHLESFYTCYRNNETGFVLPELNPKSFSHESRTGSCPTCEGAGIVRQGKKEHPCPDCRGLRLSPVILAVTLSWGGQELNLAEFCKVSIAENLEMLPALIVPPAFQPLVSQVTEELKKRLLCLQELGLDYLSLDRTVESLSGGELQRARLAGQLGGGLSGTLYILDEPTIGLHPRETERLLNALRRLRDMGNTVLVVEHDPLVLAAADYLVEMGLGAGENGGRIIAQGTFEELTANPDSPSGAWLSGKRKLPVSKPHDIAQCAWVTLRKACIRNLKNVTFRFPLASFTCISGPSGSGKSTLVHECLLPAFRTGKLEGAESLRRTVSVDQSPIGSSPRSTLATATGILDILRPLFASLPLSKQRGYTATRFSVNVRGGRCERCGGTGLLEVDMNFLADVYTECDACHGRRYNRETLEVTWRGKSIADILALTVDEALDLLQKLPRAEAILRSLHDLGLGYLQLDRPSSSLSGGEAQRIKLAIHLSKALSLRTERRTKDGERLLFILDEPSTGLHFAEIELLLHAIYALRDAGHTILCIEHNTAILERADYLVEMGLGSGKLGGKIVREGTPATLH